MSTIVEDCQFMDVPVLSLWYFDVDAHDRVDRGVTVHVVRTESEWADSDHVKAHLASECDKPWCRDVGERVKFPKYSHVGDRTFYTRLSDHVVVGIEKAMDETMFGRRFLDQYTLVPVTVGVAA